PGHDPAVAPGLGVAALDAAPRPAPQHQPAHPTGAAPVGAADGRRVPLLGLAADPGRTRRARLVPCTYYVRGPDIEFLSVHVVRSVRGGLLTMSMPSEAKTASKAAVNFESRSRMRKRKALTRSPRSIRRLRAAWVVQTAVG